MLTVTQPFGDYQIGDTITDAKLIEGILAGEHAPHVVRTVAPKTRSTKE